MWLQREIVLDPRPRGFHLVTREISARSPSWTTSPSACSTC